MREEERAGPGGRCSIDLIVSTPRKEGERREMADTEGIAKVKMAKYDDNNNNNNNNIVIITIIITIITIIITIMIVIKKRCKSKVWKFVFEL